MDVDADTGVDFWEREPEGTTGGEPALGGVDMGSCFSDSSGDSGV